METPQYLLKLTQRLLVAGHQLTLATIFFFLIPTPITNESQQPPSGCVHAPSFLFYGVRWHSSSGDREDGGTEKRRSQTDPSWVAAGTPVDSVFRDSHRATGGLWEQLGAGPGKV